MASFTAVFSVGRKTLSGTAVDKVTLTSQHQFVDVHNLSGTTDLSVTYARGGDPADPVAAANDTWVVPASRSRTIEIAGPDASPNTIVIKVLGNGNDYLVEGVG